ncbi:putative ABC transporter permease [Peptoniphilus sp. oral taxon 386]|uniref:putative ABC transporter permease n=1 Tax=Peptoniphilus sp. oral taxon 386 TaxID=652713 RepID=UPI0001DA9CB4|nr:putative ABC transporter permease [Peptoniphilus sp. oral taxon 386]EFI42647.1 hypothetical protein HMPREF0629_01306 [Peptoniphilus sp. oral taxon 386 str. F0131]
MIKILLFFIFAFLGWMTEVSYTYIDSKNYVNAGVLNGPICPIYGVGLMLILIFIYPQKNFMLVFFEIMLTATFVELITGIILEMIFKKKWWDYSDKPFNFKGYICLKYSIMWGIGGLLMCYIIFPVILNASNYFWSLPIIIPNLITSIIIILFLIDLTETALTVLKLRKHFYELDKIAANLKVISNDISSKLVKNIENVEIRTTEIKEDIEFISENKPAVDLMLKNYKNEKYRELDRIKDKYNKLLKANMFNLPRHKRLLNAFPNLKREHSRLKEFIEKAKTDIR